MAINAAYRVAASSMASLAPGCASAPVVAGGRPARAARPKDRAMFDVVGAQCHLAYASRLPQDHQQSPHVPGSQPGSDRGCLAGAGAGRWLLPECPGGLVWRGGPGQRPRYAEDFSHCEEFSNTRTSLARSEDCRNT